MNKKELFFRRNCTARLLRSSNIVGSHRNCIRISTSNSLDHEIEKLKQCYKLLKEKKEFFTEAVFADGKRTDIVVLDDCLAIEIAVSEKEESLLKKHKDYPVDFEVVRVNNNGQ